MATCSSKEGTPDGTGSHGIYLRSSPGVVSRVVDDRPSVSLPGLPADAQIGAADEFYPTMAIGANNHIAIQTPITFSGETNDAVDHMGLQYFAVDGADGG